MKHCAVLALLLAFPLFASAQDPSCVFPPADGADVDWSSPSLVGVVTHATPERVTIRAAKGNTYSVRVLESTSLFTVYGGAFDATELKVGQHALVWLLGCQKPGQKNDAVVLQVCSLAAEPCPR
nr:putative integron gene cassette protein [uncultured bacterium]